MPVELTRVITKVALGRATAGTEGARYVGAQLAGQTGTNVQTLLEALAGLVSGKLESAQGQPLTGSDRWLKLHAGGNLDALISGAITRDSNGAATSAPVVWPDGTPGTYTATVLSSAFPGAVDAYAVTYGSPVTKTVTQPAVTRGATGAVTTRPEMVVS